MSESGIAGDVMNESSPNEAKSSGEKSGEQESIVDYFPNLIAVENTETKPIIELLGEADDYRIQTGNKYDGISINDFQFIVGHKAKLNSVEFTLLMVVQRKIDNIPVANPIFDYMIFYFLKEGKPHIRILGVTSAVHLFKKMSENNVVRTLDDNRLMHGESAENFLINFRLENVRKHAIKYGDEKLNITAIAIDPNNKRSLRSKKAPIVDVDVQAVAEISSEDQGSDHTEIVRGTPVSKSASKRGKRSNSRSSVEAMQYPTTVMVSEPEPDRMNDLLAAIAQQTNAINQMNGRLLTLEQSPGRMPQTNLGTYQSIPGLLSVEQIAELLGSDNRKRKRDENQLGNGTDQTQREPSIEPRTRFMLQQTVLFLLFN